MMIKKILATRRSLTVAVLVTMGLCLPKEVYAQVHVGFKIGVTANELAFRKSSNGSPWLPNYHYVSSLHASIFTSVRLTDKIRIIPEFQYMQKSCHYYGIVYGEVRLNYVEIPVVVSVQPLKWLSAEAGGYYGINIHEKSLAGIYDEPDAGMLGGVRFNLTENLSVLARYYYGLTAIGRYITDSYIPLPEYKMYNQGLQFSFAYELK
jgi:hypothetical protein